MLKKMIELLKERIVGTAEEGYIHDLFTGKVCSFIKCLDVDFESVREQEFGDIQLDVKGCANVYESLRKFTMPERLEGENQYVA